MKIKYPYIKSFDKYQDIDDIGITEDYEADLKDFIQYARGRGLDRRTIPHIVLRKEFFSEKDLRLFAVWCGYQVKHLLRDECSINALKIGEEFAFNRVGEKELNLALRSAFEAICGTNFKPSREAAVVACFCVRSNPSESTCRITELVLNTLHLAGMYSNKLSDDVCRKFSIVEIDTILKMIDAPNGEWFLKLKTGRFIKFIKYILEKLDENNLQTY